MQSRGFDFEQRAAQWLQGQGWHILCRNYRCKQGEIDIIAQHEQQLVFVEVRARSNPRFASASGSVDWRKQRKLLRAAAHFLRSNSAWRNYPCRFDVIAFEPRQSAADLEPLWIRSAFSA